MKIGPNVVAAPDLQRHLSPSPALRRPEARRGGAAQTGVHQRFLDECEFHAGQLNPPAIVNVPEDSHPVGRIAHALVAGLGLTDSLQTANGKCSGPMRLGRPSSERA